MTEGKEGMKQKCLGSGCVREKNVRSIRAHSENVIGLGGRRVGDDVAAVTDNLPERSVLKEFKFTKGRVKSIFHNFFLNFQHLFFSSTNCVNNKCI